MTDHIVYVRWIDSGYSLLADRWQDIEDVKNLKDEVSKRKKSLRNDRGVNGEVCEGKRIQLKTRFKYNSTYFKLLCNSLSFRFMARSFFYD